MADDSLNSQSENTPSDPVVQNEEQIIPENQSIRRFATDNDHTVPLGYYKLDNPRLIRDEELIEFTVELGTQLNIPQDQYLYVGLDGTGTTP